MLAQVGRAFPKCGAVRSRDLDVAEANSAIRATNLDTSFLAGLVSKWEEQVVVEFDADRRPSQGDLHFMPSERPDCSWTWCKLCRPPTPGIQELLKTEEVLVARALQHQQVLFSLADAEASTETTRARDLSRLEGQFVVGPALVAESDKAEI
jgi:hypothetical protein